MRIHPTFLIRIGMIGLFILRHSFASTFYPTSFPDSVHDAPVIVRGKIGIHYSDWGQDPEGIKRLYTYYELIPSEIFKGQVPSLPSITIRELGGEKDGMGMQIPGTAQFEKNEDVVVFLKKRNAEGVFDVHGMMMGKFSIFIDSNQEEYLIGPATAPTAQTDSSHHWSLKELRQLSHETPPLPTAQTTPTPLPYAKAPQLQEPDRQVATQSKKGESSPSQWILIFMSLTALVILAGTIILRMRSMRSK